MNAPTVVHHDTTVTERAVLCANGTVHFGAAVTSSENSAGRLREVADAEARTSSYCGGAPHYVASRRRVTTAWERT